MEEPILDDFEKKLVRWFAEKYGKREELIGHDEFSNHLQLVLGMTLTFPKAASLKIRLENCGLIKRMDTINFAVLPACVELVRQWDNPPPEPLPDLGLAGHHQGVTEAPIYDEKDRALIRWFAEKYRNHEETLSYDTFCNHLKLHRAECSKIRQRMLVLGVIAGGETFETSIVILPVCVELVHSWDNPPMRDLWDEAAKWFRSRWWSLPALVLFGALPLIKGYWDLITLILGYIYPAGRKWALFALLIARLFAYANRINKRRKRYHIWFVVVSPYCNDLVYDHFH